MKTKFKLNKTLCVKSMGETTQKRRRGGDREEKWASGKNTKTNKNVEMGIRLKYELFRILNGSKLSKFLAGRNFPKTRECQKSEKLSLPYDVSVYPNGKYTAPNLLNLYRDSAINCSESHTAKRPMFSD